ncbi:MAG: hypothetical protein KC449_15830 [Anaerolineales bacterium]|nr:hypothetical protein [Anaerolineales bacterium]
MALEDRVKELEEELKVLKNEIQTTLLDIQEQILSHYYPSLYPSANKEANLAQANAANQQAYADAPPPQQTPVAVPPVAAALPASPAAAQQQAAVPTSRYHGKYKTQTITLVEEPEFEEDDDSAPFEEESEPVRLAVVPQTAHKKPRPAVNGRTPEKNLPVEPPPSGENLTAEDEAFLDAIVAKGRQGVSDNTAVSFDEFKELMQLKTADSGSEEELLSEELLDELLKDSFSALSNEHLDNIVGVSVSDLPETDDIPETDSINNQAVKLTVRKLLGWVDESVSVIGKTATKQAIAMYVRAGDLSEEVRLALLFLVDSSHVEPASEKAGIRQIIDTLGDLNNILDQHTPDYLNQVMKLITEVNLG